MNLDNMSNSEKIEFILGIDPSAFNEVELCRILEMSKSIIRVGLSRQRFDREHMEGIIKNMNDKITSLEMELSGVKNSLIIKNEEIKRLSGVKKLTIIDRLRGYIDIK